MIFGKSLNEKHPNPIYLPAPGQAGTGVFICLRRYRPGLPAPGQAGIGVVNFPPYFRNYEILTAQFII